MKVALPQCAMYVHYTVILSFDVYYSKILSESEHYNKLQDVSKCPGVWHLVIKIVIFLLFSISMTI